MKQIKSMTNLIMLVMSVSLILMMAGCSNVNQENYDKIETGMSYEEVVGILGNPGTSEEAILKTKNCIWGAEDKHITVKFVGDTVVLKSKKGL